MNLQSKDIGKYVVYSDGRIWSKYTQNWIKPRLHKKGYHTIRIFQNERYWHRVIAEAFLPNPRQLPQLDHINSKKWDNRVENLRWCTGAQNIDYYLEMKRLSQSKGEVKKTSQALY